MDEMRLKLTTKTMKAIVSKLISKAIYKKFGCKVDIKLNDLDVMIFNGETSINTNVEVKLNSDEFMKIVNTIEDN